MVKSFECPVCGEEVEVREEYIITPLSTKRVKFLVHNPTVIHIVRVRYHGKWEDPALFLGSGKHGFHEVIPRTRDEITFFLLRNQLMLEGGPMADGASLSPVLRAKILWKNGHAVGYYSEYTHLPVPTMAEIYVRPEYRNRGYATEMVKDFLDSHPGPVAFYHIHKKCMRNLLLKVGLVRKTYIPTERLALLSWQANPIPFWEKED